MSKKNKWWIIVENGKGDFLLETDMSKEETEKFLEKEMSDEVTKILPVK